MINQSTFLSPHLLLDIGNTKIGGAVFAGEELVARFRLENNTAFEISFQEWLDDIPFISAALISSVAVNLNEKIIQILDQNDIPYTFVSDLKLNIVNRAENVGTDRLADAYGAMKLSPGNSITIDFGTALVFNVIEGNVFHGGVICPGMGMMTRAMAEQTALLPYVKVIKPIACCGHSTEMCICSGVYFGMLGMVEKIVTQLKQEFFPNAPVSVIMTGGIFTDKVGKFISLNRELRADLAHVADFFQSDLTVIGLNEIYKVQCL